MPSKLTKGDWYPVKGPGNGKRLPTIVTESREKTIATIHFPNDRPDAADFEEAYANLEAMAAAPTLIGALQAINQAIYAAGAPLGSENYHGIRQLCVAALKCAGADITEPSLNP